jgi:hypothetical protein
MSTTDEKEALAELFAKLANSPEDVRKEYEEYTDLLPLEPFVSIRS